MNRNTGLQRTRADLKAVLTGKPGSSSEPYLIPVLVDPKKLVRALDTLRTLKSFPSPEAVNTTTGPNSQAAAEDPLELFRYRWYNYIPLGR